MIQTMHVIHMVIVNKTKIVCHRLLHVFVSVSDSFRNQVTCSSL